MVDFSKICDTIIVYNYYVRKQVLMKNLNNKTTWLYKNNL